MSSFINVEEATEERCCASCGTAEVDDVKLKKCDGCDLVRYCSDDCREDHRPEHEAMCKERAAKFRDEFLFKQPESTHLGDCPICFLPLSINMEENMLQTCCSKYICNGCSFAYKLRQLQGNIQFSCPFCRHPLPITQEETNANMMKRVAANDPVALCEFAKELCNNGDYDGTFKYFTRAAELGDADAHYVLFFMYRDGDGVQKDEKKELYHLEEAAIGGNPYARHKIGCREGINGKNERAVKHFIIAANLGDDDSIQMLKEYYRDGDIRKEDFAAALRAHHAAIEATKSPQRAAAAKYYDNFFPSF